MDLGSFIAWIPNIAVAALVILVLTVAIMVLRAVLPAAPGISLGYYEIIGRYAGQKLAKRIKGNLIDATALFINEDTEPQVKEIIGDVLAERVKRADEQEKQLLKVLAEKVEKMPLKSLARVIVTRDKLSKVVILQFGHVDKPLNAFASHEEGSRFSLGFGFLSQGIITGRIITLPSKMGAHRVGRRMPVHVFIPDAGGNPGEPLNLNMDMLHCLAQIYLYTPSLVEYKHQIDSYREQLRDKDLRLEEMGKELAAKATELDTLRIAVQGFQTTGQSPDTLTRKRFDLMDFIVLAAPTLAGYLVADAGRVSPLIGAVAGMFLGAFFVYRRR